MHKSKLGGFIIDCEGDDLDSAAAFWAEALGLTRRKLPAAEGEKYVALDNPFDLHIEVQKVDHPSRIHLDIETDNIDAEVKRLTGLGAREVRRIQSWCVMEAPSGQRFCVVQAESKQFAKLATSWDS